MGPEMRNIDLASTVRLAFSDHLMQELSGKFGLSVSYLRVAVDRGTCVIIFSLMARSASSDGALSLSSTLKSSEVNARVAQDLSAAFSTTIGICELASIGYCAWVKAVDRSVTGLSDNVALHAGIPTQAANALTGLVAATLFGILKHHVLLEEAAVWDLPSLLSSQWPVVGSHLTDALAVSLGFESVEVFRDSIPGQLRVLSGTLQRASAPTSGGTEHNPPVERNLAIVASIEEPTKRNWWRPTAWGLLACAIIGVCILYANHYYHPYRSSNTADLAKSSRHSSALVSHAASYPLTSDGNVKVPPVIAAKAGTVVSGAVQVAPVGASAVYSASAPAAASAISIESKLLDSHFRFSVNRVGAAIVSAVVQNDADKSRLLEVLTDGLGAGHYTADISVDSHSAAADWLSHVHALLPLMRVPYADMVIDGQTIEVGGAAASLSAGWRPRIQSIFGPEYNVSVFDPEKVISGATVDFKLAMDQKINSGSCEDLAPMFNLQIVDFSRGSSQIPMSATGNLDETARLLRACAGKGRPISLTIESRTDNIGDRKSNQDLSIKRANAVRLYLIKAGVADGSLSARGNGVAPIVGHGQTERDRFYSRRIVFAANP